MDVRTLAFIIIFAIGAVLFVFRLRYLIRDSRMRKKTQEEKELFLATFNPSEFADFDTFVFRLGSFSHVDSFPAKHADGWRYTIYLTRMDAEDTDTVAHEITEFCAGRTIEKLLQLKKPLYLMRKEENKGWIMGTRQKYLVEHVLATLSEISSLPKEKLEERIAPGDVEKWQLND